MAQIDQLSVDRIPLRSGFRRTAEAILFVNAVSFALAIAASGLGALLSNARLTSGGVLILCVNLVVFLAWVILTPGQTERFPEENDSSYL